MQCRLPPLLFPVLDLGIELQGKYEEEKKKNQQIMGGRPGIYIVESGVRSSTISQAAEFCQLDLT